MKNSDPVSQRQKKYLLAIKRNSILIQVSRILLFVFFVGLWEISARTGLIDSFIFSSPGQIIEKMGEMLLDHTLIDHVSITLLETLISFALVTVLGIGCGVLLWAFPRLSLILEPYLVVLNSLPKSALAPLLIVWLGSNMKTIVLAGISVAVFGAIILNKTYFGRYFYAVGGNIEAAKLSGIRVGAVKYLVFALSGFFSGLAGLVLLSRTNSGNASAAKGEEFNVITCVVLGGVSISGGSGKMSGVIAGTCIIGALRNGMVLLNINSYVQDIVLGIVLAFAVGFDCIQKKSQQN